MKCLPRVCACAVRRGAPAGARLRGSWVRAGSRETCPSCAAAPQAQQGPPGLRRGGETEPLRGERSDPPGTAQPTATRMLRGGMQS